MWRRQTVGDLRRSYGKGKNWIRAAIDNATTRKRASFPPQEVVCIFDATHIGEEILLAARAPTLKANLAWAWIPAETKDAYADLRKHIELRGFVLKAVVLDGRTGIPRVFENIPVQICQFHQRNLPFLYTYEKYPDLKIPNTTNSLDGYWSRLKNLLSAHRGKSKERMKKIAAEILRKQTA